MCSDDTIAFMPDSPVSAPGIAASLAHAYKTDQRWAFEALCRVQPLMPMWAAEMLLKGEYIVDDVSESITLIKENENE
tara:strand:+ start:373 stop:606 length:234 start_codon:yes stop_codon:yes gene_type:complete